MESSFSGRFPAIYFLSHSMKKEKQASKHRNEALQDILLLHPSILPSLPSIGFVNLKRKRKKKNSSPL